MNNNFYLKSSGILFLNLLFLLSSCSSDDFRKLHGTWTNGSIYLIIPSNDVIQISTDKDSIPEYSGSYSINGSDIFIQFASEKIPENCGGEAKYNYTINEIALNFDLVRDECPFRKDEFAKTFKKIK